MTATSRRSVNESQPALVAACEFAKGVVTDLSRRYRWLGRQITRFTNHNMSHSVARVVQSSFRALPFAVIRLVIPFPWCLIPAGAFAVCKVALSSSHPIETITDFQNGIGLGSLGVGSFQIIDGFTRANLLELVYGISNVAAAGWMFSSTGLFKEVLSPDLPAGRQHRR